MDSPIDASPAIGAVAAALLDSVDLTKGFVSLGVSLSGFGDPDTGVQLSLDLGLDDAREPERGNHGAGAPDGGPLSGRHAGSRGCAGRGPATVWPAPTTRRSGSRSRGDR